MPTPRSARGHSVVVAVVGVTALVHTGLALVPSVRPGWFAVVSAVLALAAAVALGAGLWSPRAVFGGPDEDVWLVACAALGALGVASGLVLAFVSFSGAGGAGLDLFSLGALIVDAVTVRIAVFTLRRAPAGQS